MIFFWKHLAGSLALVCLFAPCALAARVYRLPTPEQHGLVRAMSVLTAEFLKDPNLVEDSIPQLGIVVTKNRLASDIVAQSGVTDLGDVGRVHLIAPIMAPIITANANPKVPSSLWGLRSINLAKAWKVSTGAGVIVAVSDTGVSATHSALASQMWKNPGEVGTDSRGRSKSSNKIDDDGNGYIDDVFGWDFVKKKSGGVDHHYHGTHVAGTIAAAASRSMVGVAPSAKIMDVSFLDQDGSGNDVDAAKTIVYAVDEGAKIINCSWGSSEKNQILESAIQYAQKHGVLLIAAAGNDASNNDKHLFTPAGYDYDNIIAVGAGGESGNGASVASFSNYGQTSVDLAAPGENIYSLAPGNGHQSLSGTSMATPHVSGVAALVWSAHPHYTWTQVKTALMTVKPSSAWKKKCVSGGTLEAELAVTH